MSELLKHYWYWRIRFTTWRMGVIRWHVTPGPGAKKWEVFRDFHRLLVRDRSKDVPCDLEAAAREQDAVLEDYKLRYNLNKVESAALHMSFSPYRIPKGLSQENCRQKIAEYIYKKDIAPIVREARENWA